MVTRFARAETAVSAAVDRFHAERVEIVARKVGEFTAGSDPTRSARIINGVIDFYPVNVRPKEKSEYDGMRPEVDGDRVHFSFKVSELGEQSLWPRVKDHLRALDRDGQPMFQVVIVEADGIGRAVFRCVSVK